MPRFGIAFQFFHYFPSVFNGQLDIQQDTAGIERLGQLNTRITAHGYDPFIILLSGELQQGLGKIGIILNDQYYFIIRQNSFPVVRNIFWNIREGQSGLGSGRRAFLFRQPEPAKGLFLRFSEKYTGNGKP